MLVLSTLSLSLFFPEFEQINDLLKKYYPKPEKKKTKNKLFNFFKHYYIDICSFSSLFFNVLHQMYKKKGLVYLFEEKDKNYSKK